MSEVKFDPRERATALRDLLEGSGAAQIAAASEARAVEAVAATAYPATGSVASVVFWMKWQVQCQGKTFNGDSWGIAFPGGGALFGDVYTDNLNALFANTRSFAFTATPVYTAVYFFDGSSNLLGTFQAGSVSTVTGTGGGSGSWS